MLETLITAATCDVTDCLDDISLITDICGGILLSASSGGKAKVVNYLINLGCSPNVRQANLNYTPLHNAAGYGHSDIVRTLLQNGAKVDEQNFQGLTPLMFAVQNCHCEIARQILHVGCDLSVRVETSEYTVLHCGAAVGCVACVQSLVNAGVEVDAVDAMGCSALVTAVVHEHPEVVRVLLEEGHCQPNMQDDNSGMTALHR